MEKIIKAAVARGATDIHIKAGDVFRARINGELVPLTKQALTPDQTKAIALRVIPTEADRERLDSIRDYDCSWGAKGVGRFRVNILRQRSSFMLILRAIPFEVPTVAGLGLPQAAEGLAETEMGLLVVSGEVGSGRSSCIAALLHHANTHTRRHIVTLENPIEFLHRDVKSSITQREVGVDTESVRAGLQAALRQDTDVIVMENLADTATLEVVLQSVERGRLVIISMIARDAQETLSALLALAGGEDGGMLRARLVAALRGVLSLRLLPRKDGSGVVIASELAVADPALRELLLDDGRVSEVRGFLGSGAGDPANVTFRQHISRLVEAGVVDGEMASMATAGTP